MPWDYDRDKCKLIYFPGTRGKPLKLEDGKLVHLLEDANACIPVSLCGTEGAEDRIRVVASIDTCRSSSFDMFLAVWEFRTVAEAQKWAEQGNMQANFCGVERGNCSFRTSRTFDTKGKQVSCAQGVYTLADDACIDDIYIDLDTGIPHAMWEGDFTTVATTFEPTNEHEETEPNGGIWYFNSYAEADAWEELDDLTPNLSYTLE